MITFKHILPRIGPGYSMYATPLFIAIVRWRSLAVNEKTPRYSMSINNVSLGATNEEQEAIDLLTDYIQRNMKLITQKIETGNGW